MKLTNEQEAALRALPLSAARIHPVSGDALVAADGIYARIVAETGEFVGLDADEHAAAVAEIDATVAHLAARAAAVAVAP